MKAQAAAALGADKGTVDRILAEIGHRRLLAGPVDEFFTAEQFAWAFVKTAHHMHFKALARERHIRVTEPAKAADMAVEMMYAPFAAVAKKFRSPYLLVASGHPTSWDQGILINEIERYNLNETDSGYGTFTLDREHMDISFTVGGVVFVVKLEKAKVSDLLVPLRAAYHEITADRKKFADKIVDAGLRGAQADRVALVNYRVIVEKYDP